MALLIPSDFTDIGDLANHCDIRKLNIAINEASEFDMDNLFCDFWQEVVDNWDSVEVNWVNLIDGGEYTGCGDKIKKHKGLKDVLKYYSYARYLILNNFNDTPSGAVSKTNNFSIPIPLKDLEAMSDKYRNMAIATFEKTQSYLCVERAEFPNFNDYDCAPCGCGGNCGTKTTNTKGYGITSKVVTKKL